MKQFLILSGVTLWMTWKLGISEEHQVTCGPIEAPVLGQKVEWDIHSKQGVHLLKKIASKWTQLETKVTFKASPDDAGLEFAFLRR